MKLLKEANIGDVIFGFELTQKRYVSSKSATLYTMMHKKTGAELLYFDRDDENKTFCIAFKTLPEDDTGVFHILEHSVLNGSAKYPVKEPFVSMLQSSMHTYLNAMTFPDKTVYPISSRNYQDFFNLMSVYLDAVFFPKIYEGPNIFMQEGWHYEFADSNSDPYYNGVVYSEMKGVMARTDSVIEYETNRMLFADNSYGYVSGGHPESIPDLTYEKFIDTHRTFYHPSNARIFLDGSMDIAAVLEYIDKEYLSKFDHRINEFDFIPQAPKVVERNVKFQAKAGEEDLAHMAAAKIFCNCADVEKLYAAQILADYLVGSNEAPMKRPFLEKGLAQDVSISVEDGVFQPRISFVVRNTREAQFDEIKLLIAKTAKDLVNSGLNKKALSASIERFSFQNREIKEPYGLLIALRALDAWLYGLDPLTHIDNSEIFDSLRKKLDTEYYENLILELFADMEDKSYLYVTPSLTKSNEDEENEKKKLNSIVQEWDSTTRRREYDLFKKMSEWQKSADDEEALKTLPHLNLSDIPLEIKPNKISKAIIKGREVISVESNTNGIVYLNIFFDISDLNIDELKTLNLITDCFEALSTSKLSSEELQTEIKAKLGGISAGIELVSAQGDIDNCVPYFTVSASILEENSRAGMALITDILTDGRIDDVKRIQEIVVQNEYFLKQSLIGRGHVYAINKSLSAFSKAGALKEELEGENYVKWISAFVGEFAQNADDAISSFKYVMNKIFSKDRAFIGFSGNLDSVYLERLIDSLPQGKVEKTCIEINYNTDNSVIEIPSGVGFSAIGSNIYALGEKFTGCCSVLSSLVTYSYLWNAVRVQGGAYGTGMNIRANGDIFCYSYRDPNLENTRSAYLGLTAFLKDYLDKGVSIDDIIIGTVNTTDPLLGPSALCALECTRYLKGTTHDDVARIRKEILTTTADDLKKLINIIAEYLKKSKYCAVGNENMISFAKPQEI